MKKQKKIDLLSHFQFFLRDQGLINDADWTFEKQAKKFVKKLARQKRLEKLIEADGSANESFTKLKEQLDELKQNLSEAKKPARSDNHPLDIDIRDFYDDDEMTAFNAAFNNLTKINDEAPKVVETGKGRRLYTKCNRGDVVRSYVEESNLNKGEYVLVIQCRNGKKFIVAGDHHSPTYLKPYDQSSDIVKK